MLLDEDYPVLLPYTLAKHKMVSHYDSIYILGGKFYYFNNKLYYFIIDFSFMIAAKHLTPVVCDESIEQYYAADDGMMSPTTTSIYMYIIVLQE